MNSKKFTDEVDLIFSFPILTSMLVLSAPRLSRRITWNLSGFNCIKTRFSQPGYRALKNIEQLILNVINGLEYQNQVKDVLSDCGEEVNHYRLSTQLQILKTKFVESNKKTVSAVINYMKNNIGVQPEFYSEIIVLLKLYLASAATNAVSERSASSMRRIKKLAEKYNVTRKTESLYAAFKI